jgi:hypothetical protein
MKNFVLFIQSSASHSPLATIRHVANDHSNVANGFVSENIDIGTFLTTLYFQINF